MKINEDRRRGIQPEIVRVVGMEAIRLLIGVHVLTPELFFYLREHIEIFFAVLIQNVDL